MAAVDLGLVSIYRNMNEFTGSVTLAGGSSTTKTFTATNASADFESYISIDSRISTEIRVTGNTVAVIFRNTSSANVSTSFNLRIGFTGD